MDLPLFFGCTFVFCYCEQVVCSTAAVQRPTPLLSLYQPKSVPVDVHDFEVFIGFEVFAEHGHARNAQHDSILLASA